MPRNDAFNARETLQTAHGEFAYYRLSKLEESGLGQISRLPFSVQVLLEAMLRNVDGYAVTEADVRNLAAAWAHRVLPGGVRTTLQGEGS